MLNRSLKLAFPYAEIFASQNKTLYPLTNTVLQDLISASTPIVDITKAAFVDTDSTDITNRNPQEVFIDSVDAVTNGDTVDGAPSDWGNRIDGYVQSLSGLVAQHISYARNTVQPAVKELALEIIRLKELYASKTPGSNFDIQVTEIASVLRDDTFLDMIKNYRGHDPVRPSKAVLTYKGMSPEELQNFISTGMKRVDESIKEWLLTQDSDLLSRIWVGFFSTEGATARPLDFDLIQKANPVTKANYALAYFLIANAFSNKIEEGIEGVQMTLASVRQLAADHLNCAGTLLAGAVNLVASQERTGVMVLEANKRHRTIVVNNHLYKDWIKDSEDNDVLLGMLVSDDSAYTVTRLNEQASKYRSQWHSYMTAFYAHERNRVKTMMSEGVLNAFVSSLENKDEVELEYAKGHPDCNDRIYNEAKAAIEQMCDKLIDDPYETALCLVAGIRFHFTPAEQLLRDIQKAYEINPEVEVRESALLATINYVADYLAYQLGVK